MTLNVLCDNVSVLVQVRAVDKEVLYGVAGVIGAVLACWRW